MQQTLPSRRLWALTFWDALVWATVLFPLITGGIWIHRPGLKVELTQINGPVIGVALLGFLLHRKMQTNVFQASSIRFCLFVWNWWNRSLLSRPITTLLGATLFASFLWALVAMRRHWAFSSGYADLGIFDSAIWNLTHGNGYVSSVKGGMNLFADHQSPIFWLLAPLYAAIPRAETLLAVQSIGLCSGAVAAWLVARQYLGGNHRLLPLVPLLWLAWFPLRNANRFDFHPEVLMLPLFLFAIAGLQSGKWVRVAGGAIAFLLALTAKESAGPVAVGVGLAWILGSAPESVRKRNRGFGIAALMLGGAVFWFDTKVVPHWFSADYHYVNAYAHFGDSTLDLLLAPILQPGHFLQTVLTPSRLRFFFSTVAPLALVPLLAPRTFLAALPGYAIYFLTEGDHRVNIGYHYCIESGVGVWWALAPGILQAEKLLRHRGQWLGVALVLCAAAGYGRSETHYIRFFSPSPHHVWLKQEVFPRLHPEAKLSSTGTFVPHLTQRYWSHHLPVVNLPNRPGEFVDCILWSQNPEVNNTPLNETNIPSLQATMKEQGFHEVYSCDGLQVWKNPKFSGSCLTSLPSRCAAN